MACDFASYIKTNGVATGAGGWGLEAPFLLANVWSYFTEICI